MVQDFGTRRKKRSKVSPLPKKGPPEELPTEALGERAPSTGGEEKPHHCRPGIGASKDSCLLEKRPPSDPEAAFPEDGEGDRPGFQSSRIQSAPLERLRRLVKGTWQVYMKIQSFVRHAESP